MAETCFLPGSDYGEWILVYYFNEAVSFQLKASVHMYMTWKGRLSFMFGIFQVFFGYDTVYMENLKWLLCLVVPNVPSSF